MSEPEYPCDCGTCPPLDERADAREERQRTKREFRPDNRRSVRMQAILSTRKRPVNRRKRGAK